MADFLQEIGRQTEASPSDGGLNARVPDVHRERKPPRKPQQVQPELHFAGTAPRSRQSSRLGSSKVLYDLHKLSGESFDFTEVAGGDGLVVDQRRSHSQRAGSGL